MTDATSSSAARPPTVGLCDHCGLPLKAGTLRATVAGLVQNFCCYGCLLCQKIMGSPDSSGAYGWTMAKMSLGWLLGGPIMGLSFADYVGGFEGATQADQWMVAWIIFGLATAIFFLLGVPYLWSGMLTLLRGKITADVLIAIGYASAYGFSAYNLLTADDIAVARERMYFDSGSMIIVLVSLGKFVEAAARRRTGHGLRELSAIQMGEAIRVASDGSEQIVAAGQLEVGDTVRVMPGATVPADGEVVRGESSISEAILTGESVPITKRAGMRVLAGTINGGGVLEVRVESVGEECVSAKVVALAREALRRRSPTELAVDRVASIFVPAVMVVAGVAFWLAYEAAVAGGEGAADPIVAGIQRALSVLVVSCPCALGLATPLAIAIAINRGVELGMFFRSGEAVEALAVARRLYIDKTGTLTTGTFEVTRRVLDVAEGTQEAREALGIGLALESASEHWLATAIVADLRARNVTPCAVERIRSIPGRGVEGWYKDKRWWVGAAELAPDASVSASVAASIEAAKAQGEAIALYGDQDRVMGVFGLTDAFKPGAVRMVQGMLALGIEPILVTGDHEVRAQQAATQLGITAVHAGIKPEGKLAIIEADPDPRRAAMTGDGVNDGPALMRAGVGVSFSDATGLARIAAGLTLGGGDLRKLGGAIVLARKTRRIVYGNLAWAFGYNIVAIAFALTGHLSAVMAAFAMLGSSTFVVRNSWRLNRFGGG